MTVTIRLAGQADGGFLADMLVEAANWHSDRVRPRVEVLADPVARHYLHGWQRPADGGVLALDAQGDSIGACWFRVLPEQEAGYGWVAVGVPELTLGVRPIWRAQGVGRSLLRAACVLAQQRGHQRISLSVERANFAQRLYITEGFGTVASGKDSDTMVKLLR